MTLPYDAVEIRFTARISYTKGHLRVPTYAWNSMPPCDRDAYVKQLIRDLVLESLTLEWEEAP